MAGSAARAGPASPRTASATTPMTILPANFPMRPPCIARTRMASRLWQRSELCQTRAGAVAPTVLLRCADARVGDQQRELRHEAERGGTRCRPRHRVPRSSAALEQRADEAAALVEAADRLGGETASIAADSRALCFRRRISTPRLMSNRYTSRLFRHSVSHEFDDGFVAGSVPVTR